MQIWFCRSLEDTGQIMSFGVMYEKVSIISQKIWDKYFPYFSSIDFQSARRLFGEVIVNDFMNAIFRRWKSLSLHMTNHNPANINIWQQI